METNKVTLEMLKNMLINEKNISIMKNADANAKVIVKKMVESTCTEEVKFDETNVAISIPVVYAEDSNGNINFDTDSMRELFNEMMDKIEQHNEESDFNWED